MVKQVKNYWLQDSMQLNNIKFNIDLFDKNMMNKEELIKVIKKILNDETNKETNNKRK